MSVVGTNGQEKKINLRSSDESHRASLELRWSTIDVVGVGPSRENCIPEN